MERELEPGTSWLGWYGGLGEPIPVRELYSVFQRPRNEADRRAELIAAVSWTGMGPGDVSPPEGRVFHAGLGGDMDTIFAAPFGADRLAVAVLPNGGGHWGARPGPDGLLLITSQLENGDLVVNGIVADSVESVNLVVAGVTHEAAMGENGFGLRLEDTHEADQERLVLHRRDGTTNEIDLSPRPGA
jgi:hypothetical protein